MEDARINTLAEILLTYCTHIHPHMTIVITSPVIATPLVEALYKEILIRGAHPEVVYYPPSLESLFYTYASDNQIQYISPLKKFRAETADVILDIRADTAHTSVSSVSSEILVKKAHAQQSLQSIISQRAAQGSLQWVLTMFPTHALAQQAGMSLLEYESFFYHACFIHCQHPVKAWKKLSASQRKWAYTLNKKSQLRITGEGTDIHMNIQNRKWINADGHRNFPSGEIFTCPVENSVEGTIQFTYPGIFGGKSVENIILTFEKGAVVASSARSDHDNEILHNILTTDAGSSHLGEVAIGTNPQITTFTNNILLDEKMGGTIHLALGRSFIGTRGKNQSAIHWDLIKDMRDGGCIYADNELIYENGAFIL